MAQVTFSVPARFSEIVVSKLTSDAARWNFNINHSQRGEMVEITIEATKRICNIAAARAARIVKEEIIKEHQRAIAEREARVAARKAAVERILAPISFWRR